MNIRKIRIYITPNIIKYLAVGIGSFMADYCIFLTLYYVLGFSTAVAAPVGLVVGLIVNFTINKIWSFGNREIKKKDLIRQLTYYVLLVAFNSMFTYMFIEWLKNSHDVEPRISKLLASVCTILWNYIIYKKIIFKPNVPKEVTEIY
jgi:putative flippase GtrA